MKIGNLEVENNIFLAPMAGITDTAFRQLCKEQGCGLVYSEMISAKGLMYDNDNTKNLLKINKNEGLVAIQLFGSDPKILSNMVKKLENYENIALFDINMGCPASKIVKNGEGSALMKNPKLIGKIVKSVSSSTKKPLTIKIRKGYTNDNINALEVAKIAQDNGVSAITIHGRTAEELYTGVADWDIIRKIKENINIPVIGNGDITSGQKAKDIFEYTKCDAIMVARATQGNPWIFKQIIKYMETGEAIKEPTIYEKLNMAVRHMELLVECKGEYTAIREMRKHIGWYIKGVHKSAEIRVLINKIENLEEMRSTVLSIA